MVRQQAGQSVPGRSTTTPQPRQRAGSTAPRATFAQWRRLRIAMFARMRDHESPAAAACQ